MKRLITALLLAAASACAELPPFVFAWDAASIDPQGSRCVVRTTSGSQRIYEPRLSEWREVGQGGATVMVWRPLGDDWNGYDATGRRLLEKWTRRSDRWENGGDRIQPGTPGIIRRISADRAQVWSGSGSSYRATTGGVSDRTAAAIATRQPSR